MAQEVQTHTVEPGETLYSIAAEYGLSLDDLRALNDLQDDAIYVGQELVVAESDQEVTADEPEGESVEFVEGELVAAEEYRAGTGDTFFSIAERLEVTADTLAALNPELLDRPLEPGDVVAVPDVVHTEVTHIVQSGETLSSVADHYGVSAEQIRELNNMESDVIHPEQSLTIRQETPPEEDPWQELDDGPVAIYPNAFAGRLTASGETYDPELFTASHPSLEFGSIVVITNPATGRSTFARVNDRGPVDQNLIMEISVAVAEVLELEEFDEQPVQVQLIR